MSEEIRAYDAGYKQGIKDEHERVISLLREEIDPKVLDAQMMTIAWCVALIEGGW